MRSLVLSATVLGVGLGYGLIYSVQPAPAAAQEGPVTSSNQQCPKESLEARYNPQKPPNEVYQSQGSIPFPIRNLYGKRCFELSQTVFVQGHCVAAGKCEGDQYIGQDGKLHKAQNPDQNPNKDIRVASADKAPIYSPTTDYTLAPADASDGGGPIKPAAQPSSEQTPASPSAPSPRSSPSPTSPAAPPPVDRAPVSSPPVSAPSSPSGPPASEGIRSIADTPTDYSGGGARPVYGAAPVFQYAPTDISQGITNPGDTFYLSSGGSPYHAPVGPVAYVPTIPGTIYNDRTFDRVGAPITFSETSSSYDRIAQIAEQQIAAENEEFERMVETILREQFPQYRGPVPQIGTIPPSVSPVESPLTRFTEDVGTGVRDVFAGVVDFFSSLFEAPEGEETEGVEEPAVAGQPSVEVEVDSTILVPGDPTSVLAEVPEGPLPQEPDSFRALPGEQPAVEVDTTPPAAIELIDEIARGPARPASDLAARPDVPRVPATPIGVLPPPEYGGVDIAPEPPAPVTVVSVVRDVIDTVVSRVASAIRAGIRTLTSWF